MEQYQGRHRDDDPSKLRWPDRFMSHDEFERAYAKQSARWATLMERMKSYDGPVSTRP